MQNEENPDGQTVSRESVDSLDYNGCSLWRSYMLRRGYIWIRYAYFGMADMGYIVFSTASGLGNGVGFTESH